MVIYYIKHKAELRGVSENEIISISPYEKIDCYPVNTTKMGRPVYPMFLFRIFSFFVKIVNFTGVCVFF